VQAPPWHTAKQRFLSREKSSSRGRGAAGSRSVSLTPGALSAKRVGFITEESELVWEDGNLERRMSSKFKNPSRFATADVRNMQLRAAIADIVSLTRKMQKKIRLWKARYAK